MKQNTPELLKFRRLCASVKVSKVQVIGHLELLWRQANISSDPNLPIEDIEIFAEWEGEPGVFLQALLRYGWLDSVDKNTVAIHNYWHHAPDHCRSKWFRKHKTKPWLEEISRPIPDKSATPPPAYSPSILPEHTTGVCMPTTQSSPVQSSPVLNPPIAPLDPPTSASKHGRACAESEPDEAAKQPDARRPTTAADILAITGDDPSHYGPWWQAVINRVTEHGDGQRIAAAISDTHGQADPGKVLLRTFGAWARSGAYSLPKPPAPKPDLATDFFDTLGGLTPA